MLYVLVAIGSGIGGALRFWLSSLIANWAGQTFPWGTLVVNILGSFIIVLFATLTAPDARLYVPGEWRAFVMVGVCGGFTTFSSFSMQTLALAQSGEWASVGMNIGFSVGLCLIGAWLGAVAGNAINA
ncbi:MAG: fluoride efflux transporter CrcB [Rhodospirillaceae bacterium]|nr:fluoride efflux transporter CrcB [Rhodospirillaceae bacterium]